VYSCLAALGLLLLGLSPIQAATFSVTTTADSGPGSLREAIVSVNATTNPRIGLARFEIRLIPAHDGAVVTRGKFLAAVLDARIPLDDAICQRQLKILQRPVGPNQKGVVLDRILAGGASGDHTVFHGPKVMIAAPSGEVAPIEQRFGFRRAQSSRGQPKGSQPKPQNNPPNWAHGPQAEKGTPQKRNA
jgi:hypothetical protein